MQKALQVVDEQVVDETGGAAFERTSSARTGLTEERDPLPEVHPLFAVPVQFSDENSGLLPEFTPAAGIGGSRAGRGLRVVSGCGWRHNDLLVRSAGAASRKSGSLQDSTATGG